MKELIQLAMSGDQDATTQLYNSTYNNVYQTIKAIIGIDEDTVLDLVQDTYIKAFKYLGQLDQPENFRAWVKRIAANTAKNYLKKKKPVLFSQLEKDDEEPQEFQFRDERPEHMPEVVVDQKETTRLVGDILDTLSDDQRLALTMFYFDEMTVREIAQELECSENTVKSRLNYGRKKVETKVRELEKRGTKLYGLAPMPFFLFLLRMQETGAAVVPNEHVLRAIQAGVAGATATTATAAGTAAAGAGATTSGTTATTATASTTATTTTAATKATTAAAKATAKIGLKTASTKVVAGVAAAAVVGGAGAAIYTANQHNAAVEEFVQAYEYFDDNNVAANYDTMEVYFNSTPKSKKDWDVVVVLLRSEEVNSMTKNYAVMNDGVMTEHSIDGSPRIEYVESNSVSFTSYIARRIPSFLSPDEDDGFEEVTYEGTQYEIINYSTSVDLTSREERDGISDLLQPENYGVYVPMFIGSDYQPLEAALSNEGYEEILKVLKSGKIPETTPEINITGTSIEDDLETFMYESLSASGATQYAFEDDAEYYDGFDVGVYDEILSEWEEQVLNDEGNPDGRGNAYAYYDVNEDGYPEFLIADTYYDENDDLHASTICKIYSYSYGDIVQTDIEGWSRNRYTVYEDGYILNSYSSGADESGEMVLQMDGDGYIDSVDMSAADLGSEAEIEFYLMGAAEVYSTDTSADMEQSDSSGTAQRDRAPWDTSDSNLTLNGKDPSELSFEEILQELEAASHMSLEAYNASPDYYDERYSYLGEGVAWILIHREEGIYTLDFFYREYDIDGDGELELLVGRGVSPSRVTPFVIYNLHEEPITGDALNDYTFPDEAGGDYPMWNYAF